MHTFGDSTEANRESPADVRNARYNVSRWEMMTIRACAVEREDRREYGSDNIAKVHGLRYTGG